MILPKRSIASNEVKTNINLLQIMLDEYFQTLSIQKFEQRNKLRYNPSIIILQCEQLLKNLILQIMVIKYSALIHIQNEREYLLSKDYKVKRIYQDYIKVNKGRLNNQLYFQQFVIVTIKLFDQVFSQHFEEYEFSQADNAQIYCLIIKIIIGLNVIEKGYELLIKKFIDNEKYDVLEALKLKELQKFQLQNTTSKIFISKRNVNNLVQRKISHRKQKRQSSLLVRRNNRYVNQVRMTQLQNFVQELKKQLKVNKYVKAKHEKIKKKVPKTQNSQVSLNQKNKQFDFIKNNMRKQVLNTEQVSSSMHLVNILRKQKERYTHRNVVLRHTDVSRVKLKQNKYELNTIKKNRLDQSFQYRKNTLQQTQQVKMQPANDLVRKTGTYWQSFKKKIEGVNDSFLY